MTYPRRKRRSAKVELVPPPLDPVANRRLAATSGAGDADSDNEGQPCFGLVSGRYQ